MAATLREREAHIRQQIERNETCTITLRLRGAGDHGAVPAGLVGALLAAADAADGTARAPGVASSVRRVCDGQGDRPPRRDG